MKLFSVLSATLLLAVAAQGQALVEYSVATAGASTAAAGGAKGVGSSIGGVFNSLNQILNQAAKSNGDGSKSVRSASTTPSTIVLSAPKQYEKPVPVKPVNPVDVVVGLERAELLERYGPPLVSTTDTVNSQLTERMWYPGTTSAEVEIKLTGGKVASILPPPGKEEAKK
jgi:hypothetical protein